MDILEENKSLLKAIASAILILIILMLVLMFYWDTESDLFDVKKQSQYRNQGSTQFVTGYVTTATMIEVAETLLNKRGGYLSNDIMPPGVMMDNIPNWEFGVLTQLRDLGRSMRNDFSRSQTQSIEDKDLMTADPQFHFDSESWILPATEGEYKKGIDALNNYLRRLSDPNEQDAQFFSRADNLRDWLAIVEKRLGSLSQRLSASVGQARVNTDLEGDAEATQSTVKPDLVQVKTPWLEIDDIFYEARGTCWALVHFMHAIEYDLHDVLQKKNALVSLRQIIRELEATQDMVWSPVILNGTGFGFVANHSLVMASYISSANAAVIDLRNLLEQG
ncbi:MAG: DUF2333 family protein [Proteobacteria bacterium]|nr:DUF2333 family protein [Pseudomonadota bacterium]NOG60776.1 DUF2333 family protein [Pseudomonadota bacterium]